MATRNGLAAAALVLLATAASTGSAAEALQADRAPENAIWVDELDIRRMSQRRGTPRAGRTIRDQPIVVGGWWRQTNAGASEAPS